MVQRIVNCSLMLAIGVGAYLLISARAEHHEAKQEYDRLTAKVGRFEISDPTKFHFAALPTDDPFEFAWRVYVPAGSSMEIRTTGLIRMSGSSAGFSPKGVQIVYRVRLRFTREHATLSVRDIDFSFASFLGGEDLTKFLHDHQHELVVESLAKNEAAYDASQVVTLLTIEIPDHLRAEAFPGWSDKRRSNLMPVIRIHVGTAKALAAAGIML